MARSRLGDGPKLTGSVKRDAFDAAGNRVALLDATAGDVEPLERLDIASGRIEQRYAVPGGVEGISFDASGRMWAVSEAGARHIPWRYPFFPVLFRLDIEHLIPAP